MPHKYHIMFGYKHRRLFTHRSRATYAVFKEHNSDQFDNVNVKIRVLLREITRLDKVTLKICCSLSKSEANSFPMMVIMLEFFLVIPCGSDNTF